MQVFMEFERAVDTLISFPTVICVNLWWKKLKSLIAGGHEQVGCEDSTMSNSCDHSRSWQMYQESVRNPYSFEAVKCDSFENFKSGSCSSGEKTFMGFGTDEKVRGKFYLRTYRNVFKMSLGSAGLYFNQTNVCYGPTNCQLRDEFFDWAKMMILFE